MVTIKLKTDSVIAIATGYPERGHWLAVCPVPHTLLEPYTHNVTSIMQNDFSYHIYSL